MQKLLIGVALTVLLASCATSKDKEMANSGKPAPITEGSAASDSASTSGLNSSSASASDLNRNSAAARASNADAEAQARADAARRNADAQAAAASQLSKRSVYYPLDVYVVQDADKPIVQANAQYLSTHADLKVRLEGNCDERGSTEYNLALGQRRADGVKQMLLLGGVKASQIDSVSFGEAKPKAEGHAEEAWAQNRRTDFNYGG